MRGFYFFCSMVFVIPALALLGCYWITQDENWGKVIRITKWMAASLNPRPVYLEDENGDKVTVWGPPWKL